MPPTGLGGAYPVKPQLASAFTSKHVTTASEHGRSKPARASRRTQRAVLSSSSSRCSRTEQWLSDGGVAGAIRRRPKSLKISALCIRPYPAVILVHNRKPNHGPAEPAARRHERPFGAGAGARGSRRFMKIDVGAGARRTTGVGR